MDLDLSSLSKGEIHRLLTQCILPRPVAWVLSDNGNGTYNLAPFSYFSGLSSAPPLLLISVGRKPGGARKDTWVNVVERDDFVVHIPPRELAEAVTQTSATLPHGESELDLTGLATVPMEGSRLPRVVGPKIALACRKYQVIEVGDGPQGLILGEIRRLHLDDDVARREGESLLIDPLKVNPVARLGGNDYGFLGDILTVPRPK